MTVPPTAPYILYIDDDEDDLEIMKEVLASINAGLSFTGINNGEKAFHFLEGLAINQALPCVIVIDWNMPGWNGMKTLAAIKQREVYNDIPAYIFTNSNHPRHKEEALASGANDFLSKPYELADFKKIAVLFASYATKPVLLKK